MADISKIEGYNLKDASARLSIEQIYNYIRFPYISNNDKVPYLFRKSGGSLSVGDWEEDKLVGGSVSFNQLIQNGDFPDGTESSWSATGCTIAFSDNKCTITASSSIAAASNIRQNVLTGKENHVIFASQTITSPKAVGGGFYIGENYVAQIPVPANTRTVVEGIQQTKSSYTNTQLYFYFNRGATLSQGDTLTIENAFAIDLTQMFGEEVAQYFFNLEQATPGEGVKAFRSLFPNVYYAYNTGEIISVKTSAHKTTGIDENENEWEQVYPLDSNLELRGAIKLNSTTNTLYNDGDTYDSDGTVVRKYGYVEFDGSSDENWEFYNNTIFRISFTDAAGNQGLISNWLPTSSGSTFGIRATTAYILCYQILSNIPSVTDLASWKTYLSTHPLQVRYTLATPTTETATPFTNPQRVFNNGTEQYIDNRTIAIPVGHETKYQTNI